MRFAPLVLVIATALLTACAPDDLSRSEAQDAMQARMERPGARTVKVLQIHEFQITGCADAAGQAGRVCTVTMDVAFTVDEAPQRDKATQQMRFAYEDGRWVAYPGP